MTDREIRLEILRLVMNSKEAWNQASLLQEAQRYTDWVMDGRVPHEPTPAVQPPNTPEFLRNK